MLTLGACAHCEGFLPPGASTCPHCGTAAAPATVSCATRRAGLASRLLTVASGGLMALTLMACYGAPPCDDPPQDLDGDGYQTFCDYDYHPEADCDDSNPDIHPGAIDPRGDGIDQNCDFVDGVAGDTGSGGGGAGGGGGSGGSGAGGGGTGGGGTGGGGTGGSGGSGGGGTGGSGGA